MAQGNMKRLWYTSAQGMLRGPSRQAAGSAPVQNPSGDAWVMAEGSPVRSERTDVSAALAPGDAQPVPRHGRKSRWNTLKAANPPIASQNVPLVTMQGLRLSPQLVTPKHLPGALWRVRTKLAGRPWEAAWEEGAAPASHPCPSHPMHPGTFTLTPTTCPVHRPSVLLPVTTRRSSILPRGEQHPPPRPPQLLWG